MKETKNMKLTVDRAALVAELQYVNKAVPSNPTLPCLGCVLLVADGGALKLQTSDLDLALSGRVPAEVAAAGAVGVGAKRLERILAQMSDDVVSISSDAKHAVEIIGAGCRFKLNGLPDDDFPAEPKHHPATITIPGSVLADAVRPVLHAVSTDETRFVLNSVLLKVGAGEVFAVATDGRRLASCGGDTGPDAVMAIVPTKAARLLVALAEAESLDVAIGENIWVNAGARTATAKLIVGNYPNYAQVIPKAQPLEIEVDAAVIRAALHRVALVAGETVSLTFGKTSLVVSGTQADIGSGAESLCISDGPGKNVAIAFAPAYVVDALASCGDTATLHLEDETCPMVVTADRFLAVIMPKRVS